MYCIITNDCNVIVTYIYILQCNTWLYTNSIISMYCNVTHGCKETYISNTWLYISSDIHIYCNVTNECTEILTFDRVINGCMLIVTCNVSYWQCDNTFPPTPLNFPPSVYPEQCWQMCSSVRNEEISQINILRKHLHAKQITG